MIIYDRIDFLEFFDTEEYITEQEAIIKYTVTSRDNFVLTVLLCTYEQEIYFKLTSPNNIDLVTFNIENVKSILCDKKQTDRIRFLFYEYGQHVPIVAVCIKPDISLGLDIEHKKDINQFPYLEIKD